MIHRGIWDQDTETTLKATRKKDRSPDSLVPLTIRVHREARAALKSTAALSEQTMEERCRSILYPAIGVHHLPAVVEPTATTS